LESENVFVLPYGSCKIPFIDPVSYIIEYTFGIWECFCVTLRFM